MICGLKMNRPNSEYLDRILGEQFKVHEHGFIRVVDYMGNDSSVVQAARVSYGKGTKTVREDEGLIHYLMRHRHTSPFEMCEIKFHIKLPIFVARQWIRHRTASVNEYSARYSILSNEFYNPSLVDMGGQSDINKQCREDEPIDNAVKVRQRIHNESQQNHEFYKWLLEPENGDVGIARELARMNLSLNFYTEWYWKINLHNLLNFITLRNHKFAQKEIVDYAKVINHIVGGWVPITHSAFLNYVKKSHRLSGEALEVAKALLQGQSIESQKSKLKESEWREMIQPLLD